MAVTSKRIAILIATIYGIMVLIAAGPMYLFSFQQSQPLLMRIAGAAYCLTLFPAALVSIKWKSLGGGWMLFISAMSLPALWVNEITRYRATEGVASLIVGLTWWSLISIIPAVLGLVVLNSKKT